MNHRPRKRFGQNFLHDQNIIDRMVKAIAPSPEADMVEIGPGLGALTRPLLQQLGQMDAIELDRDVIEPLTRNTADVGTLRIHSQDALSTDFTTFQQPERPLRVVGNLPYNISTPLLFHITQWGDQIQDMHFLLQKEVVDRMAAPPGDGTYGRLSVMIQYHCQVEPLFDVPPGAFNPPPKVRSTFVRLTPYSEPPVRVNDLGALRQIVNQAFSQRRKTLRKSLKGLLSAETMEAAGIDPSLRPERLDLDAFATLANTLKQAD